MNNYQLGLYYLKNNNIENSLKYFQLSAKYDNDMRSAVKIAILYSYKDGYYHDLKKAEQYLKLALNNTNMKNTNFRGQIHNHLGYIYSHTRDDTLLDINKAIFHYNEAIKMGYLNSYRNLSGLYKNCENIRNINKAIILLEKCIKLYGDIKSMFALVDIYITEYNDFDKSKKQLDKISNMKLKKSDEAELYKIYAYLYSTSNLTKYNDFDKAIEYYMKQYNIDKKSTSLYNIALIYDENIKDYINAEKYYQKSIYNNVIPESCYWRLGNIQKNVYKNNIKAKNFYIKSLESKPLIPHPFNLFELADIYEIENNYEMALKYYELSKNNLSDMKHSEFKSTLIKKIDEISHKI